LGGAAVVRALAPDIQGRHAFFDAADLSDATLWGSDLEHAVFTGANLTRTQFQACRLGWATFHNAVTVDADFSGVDLSAVEGLTEAQLRGARTDATTIVPARFADPGKPAPS
jgi:uncharacterized protein YjbI with pentapeptide repeats